MRGGRPQVVNIFAPVCRNALSFTGACARNSVPDGLGKNGTDADQLNKSLAKCVAKLYMCFQHVPNKYCRIYHYKRRYDTTPILTQWSILCAGVVGNCGVTLTWHACRHVGVATRRIIDLPTHDVGWCAQASACVGYHTNAHKLDVGLSYPKMLIAAGSQALCPDAGLGMPASSALRACARGSIISLDVPGQRRLMPTGI